MLRLRAILAALLLSAPLAASAADITRIASAFDEDDPFDLFIDANFERTQSRDKIIREHLVGADLEEESEVWHKAVDSRLNLKLAIGIYKDLQFSFGLPLILQQNDSYGFVSGTDSTNSTIINNCLNSDGTPIAGCQGVNGNGVSLFTIPQTSKRGGLGNMHFGLAYAFFNQERDDTKPMWLVGLDYEAPTAKVRDPSEDNTAVTNTKGNVGDGVHKYTFYTALSRKIGVAEPYFKASFTLPVLGPGFYSNCAHPASVGTPANCGVGQWTRKETGIHAPEVVGFLFGSEFTAFRDTNKDQKLSLDIRTIGNYVSAGRYYNELSAALGKLLATQDYYQLGGQVGATASAGEAFTIRASGTFLYNTDHTITNESLGIDPNDPNAKSEDINPNFDYRTDEPTRRFRATESTSFRIELSASFAF